MTLKRLSVFVLAAAWLVGQGQGQDARLISKLGPQTAPSLTGAGCSQGPAISADGRFVAFASTANNLVTNAIGVAYPMGFPPPFNVFLTDRITKTTTLVSVNASGTQGGNDNSLPTGISPDGRYVLFESMATNLVAGDTNQTWDIFVRDTVMGTTSLVSAATNGVPGNGASSNASMTPDGRYVAFVSAASNLVVGDNNGIPDVFVRDLQSGTTVLASVGALASQYSSSTSGSDAPDISADGRYVTFFSVATNLVDGATGKGDIYVRDLVAQQTIWVSYEARRIARSPYGILAPVCFNHAVSSDGPYIAFQASRLLFRYDLSLGSTSLIETNASTNLLQTEYTRNVAISDDGARIAYVARTNGTTTSSSVKLWDASGGITVISPTATTATVSARPAITPDGQNIAYLFGPLTRCELFTWNSATGISQVLPLNPAAQVWHLEWNAVYSLADSGNAIAFDYPSDDLVDDDRNKVADVFVKNLQTGATELISAANPALLSLAPDGISTIVSGASSRNGRRIVFTSTADDIAPNDQNYCMDVFVRDQDLDTNILISVAINGNSGSGPSWEPSITPDGRYVAFTSYASNLVASDANKRSDVFVRDIDGKQTTAVSISTTGSGLMSGNSSSPQISPDGRFVLFKSDGTGSGPYPYVRDRQLNKTFTLATTYTSATMSVDGRYVVLTTSSGAFSLWDLAAGAKVPTSQLPSLPTSISAFAFAPDSMTAVFQSSSQLLTVNMVTKATRTVDNIGNAIYAGLRFSADGRFVTCVKWVPGHRPQVMLYDLVQSAQNLVSHVSNSSAEASGTSDSPDISPDGRFIVYRSLSTNLVPGVASAFSAIYLYDRQTTSNLLLSANVSASPSNRRSMSPFFSTDGRAVIFQSWNPELATGGQHYASDVFACPLFYVLPTALPSSGVTLSWPASAGASYQVEFTEDFLTWKTLTGEQAVSQGQATMKDPAPNSAHRFYRVKKM